MQLIRAAGATPPTRWTTCAHRRRTRPSPAPARVPRRLVLQWGVSVDDAGLQQLLQVWADAASAPRLTWWANVVTDAGHHGAGPRSEMGRRRYGSPMPGSASSWTTWNGSECSDGSPSS